MKRRLGWMTGGFVLAAVAVRADQLAWNSKDDAERGARAIAPGSLLVAYGPLADLEAVEVWCVRDVEVAAVDEGRYHEVRISGERKFRSVRLFNEGEYAEPVEYRPIPAGESAALVREGIDLAYVYVPAGGAAFRCLGRALGMECDTPVETVMLPDDILKEAGRELSTEPLRKEPAGGAAGCPAEKQRPPDDGAEGAEGLN